MEEVSIKTHLIVTDVHEEYNIKWCGKVVDTKPLIKNGKPIFIIVGGGGRMELNTTDMNRIEKCAKLLTCPRGRAAVTTDIAYIYLKEVNGNEKLMGYLTHNHVKEYAAMYDKVGWK